MTTVSDRLPQILLSLEKAPVRFLADERTGCVIVERTNDTHKLTSETVQQFADLLQSTVPNQVLFLDLNNRLAGMQGVEQLSEVEAGTFDAIHALCFSSGFLSHLLQATRQRQIVHDIWEVSFSDVQDVAEPSPELIEVETLLRWLEKFGEDTGTQEKTASEARSSAPERQDDDDGYARPSAVARRIELRNRLRQAIELISAEQWAKLAGNRGINPSAALGKYKTQGRLFAVLDGNRAMYPAFQFSDNDASPKKAIEPLLARVPEPARGWPLLSWLNAPNVFLENRKPLDVIDSDPKTVADAADRFFGRDD